jgi:ABC-type multidrug transport system ATPase subunit/pSer/pThr/pTyr-binding forkhead associated (FHA) protein
MSQHDNSNTNARAYLVGLAGAIANRNFPIRADRARIGRDAAQCDIVLELPIVSKCHAVLEMTGPQAVIVDQQSRNGTFVNGAPVTRRELRDGDIVSFGPGNTASLRFHVAGAESGGHVARTQGAVTERQSGAAPAPAAPSNTDRQAAMRATTAPTSPQVASTIVRAADKPVLRIGRAPDNDVLLEAPGVSRYHASLTYGGQQPVIADLGSTNGTFVNGEPLKAPRLLHPTDMVSLGGFLLRVEGRSIRRVDLSVSRVSAWNVTKIIDGKTIIKDISLALWPREFIGLMGPSGCGKSTLMDSLNGLRPATSGAVYINDLDLYRNFDSLRRSIGHVPQHDILHETLTVGRTLYYVARLRLPKGTPPEQIRRVVDETILSVGLAEQRDTQFRQLSGGQQKRLSLAVELITKPSFIFLDEPTSPLDPETTENMMMLFRQLADEGRIVVMVTHRFEKFEEMHHVAILTKGGRLAFFGPPHEALDYFKCRVPTEIYRHIGSRDPDEISNAFKQSSQYREYVGGRIEEAQEMVRSRAQGHPAQTAAQRGTEREFGLGQWMTLTRRYFEVKLKDVRNTMLLLLQAPLIAILLGLITGNSLNDTKTLFFAAVISIWFGSNNAVREIVAEVPIYIRERLVNLKIPSYVFSKFTILGGIAFVQCLMFLGILVAFGRLNGGDFLILMVLLYLTSLGGIAMGLFFSALVKTTEKAMTVLPLIIIPQLLLGGLFKPIDDVYVDLLNNRPASVKDFEQYEKAKASLEKGQSTAEIGIPPIKKNGGLGPAAIASAPMMSRWSFDGLLHAVSIDNPENKDGVATRDFLAMSTYVAGYQHVLDKQGESQIVSAYRLRVFMDMAILAAFVALFLALTMWALKRKDVL